MSVACYVIKRPSCSNALWVSHETFIWINDNIQLCLCHYEPELPEAVSRSPPACATRHVHGGSTISQHSWTRDQLCSFVLSINSQRIQLNPLPCVSKQHDYQFQGKHACNISSCFVLSSATRSCASSWHAAS